MTGANGSLTVLVIDDNAANLLLTKTLLQANGYLVREAGNAEDGVRAATEAMPDLILMDIQLPGQDGLAATRALKADPATASIPVIALSAYALPAEKEAALAAGCNGYITKPIDTRAFPIEIARLLRGTG
jgi:CheY-like chemotaxis protein